MGCYRAFHRTAAVVGPAAYSHEFDNKSNSFAL